MVTGWVPEHLGAARHRARQYVDLTPVGGIAGLPGQSGQPAQPDQLPAAPDNDAG
jgi:hypothetical protein